MLVLDTGNRDETCTFKISGTTGNLIKSFQYTDDSVPITEMATSDELTGAIQDVLESRKSGPTAKQLLTSYIMICSAERNFKRLV